MKWILAGLTLLLIVLHQDFWNWDKIDPRLFGFLPIGLGYHAALAVACSVLMGLLVKFAWPTHLEHVEPEPGAVTDPNRTNTH